MRVIQADKNARKMATLALILATFSIISWISGVFAGSLSLVSAAFCTSHDVCALIVSILSLVASKQKPTKQYSYGFERFEVLLVFSCSSVMIFTALYTMFEGFEHLLEGDIDDIRVYGLPKDLFDTG